MAGQDTLAVTPGSGRTMDGATPGTVGSGVFQQAMVIGDGANNGRFAGVHALNALQVNLGASASLTANTSATPAATSGTTVTKTDIGNQGNGTITFTGGATITTIPIAFEASVDGTNWVPMDVAKSDGTWVGTAYTITSATNLPIAFNFMAPGYTQVRIRLTAAATATTMPLVTITGGPFLCDPSPSVAPIDGMKPTFRASVFGMSTINAGDLCMLTGSATRVVRLTRVEWSVASGAASSSRLVLVNRSTADSGGTAYGSVVTGSADTMDGAAGTATFSAWTANPTAGTVGAVVGTQAINTTGATSASGAWMFGGYPARCPVLRGTGQFICLFNSNALTTSGNWDITFEWTEEPY